MANVAPFVEGGLIGPANKYEYEVKVSGSSYYDSNIGKVIVDVSYSIQAINKYTKQPCPLRPYYATGTESITLLPDVLVTEYNINIDDLKVITISIA